MHKYVSAFGLSLALAASCPADEPVATARPVPLTRPAMKQLLEDMKSRELRIPIPELTDAQREELGDRADNYETRLRFHYMPAGEPSVFGYGSRRSPAPSDNRAGNSTTAGSPPARDFTRNADENMSLTYPFKTQLFWIVSRTNNCQYCLGHQEQKLSAAGLTEDEIAALDSNWGHYSPADQAAFAWARRLTFEPHRITDADIEHLRRFYTPLQILEMTMSIAGNNAINRWKEGTGTPQSHSGSNFFARAENVPKDRPLPIDSFLTPTSAEYQTALSQVVPVQRDASGKPTPVAVSNRPALQPRDEVEAALVAARQRTARLPVLSEDEARAALGDQAPAGPVPNWMRLMANFPNESRRRIDSVLALEEEVGDLSPLLKAQVSWIIARQDRAWYATGLVKERLRHLGQSDDEIYALDGDWKGFTPAEQSLFRFARHLAATPIALTDDDVADALARTGPREVVQLINFVTSRAYFDRVTEAAGLPLDTVAVSVAE